MNIGDPPSEHRRPAVWWEGAFSEIMPERGRLSVMEKISYGSIDNEIANRSGRFEASSCPPPGILLPRADMLVGDPPSKHRRPAAWWEGYCPGALPGRGPSSVMLRIAFGSADNDSMHESERFEVKPYPYRPQR